MTSVTVRARPSARPEPSAPERLRLTKARPGSHGQTFAAFALFDVVGCRLYPWIAKLGKKRRNQPRPASRPSGIGVI